MSTDAKPSPSSPTPPAHPVAHREKGMRIFMWPKVIFLYPTAIVALICWAGMWIIHDRTHDPTRAAARRPSTSNISRATRRHFDATSPARLRLDKVDRFKTPQNLLAMLFLGMFAFNLLVMALDFPRFALVAWILAVLLFLFFVLWIGSYLRARLDASRSTRSSRASMPSPTAAST